MAELLSTTNQCVARAARDSSACFIFVVTKFLFVTDFFMIASAQFTLRDVNVDASSTVHTY
jgi:hypothetical protein